MLKLTRKEEELMKVLWDLEKAFVKDIVEKYPDPKPHYNTISSLVRLLQNKNIIGFERYGNTYQYHPLVSKEEYSKSTIRGIVGDYFDNSYKSIVSFLINEESLSDQEAEELISIIKNKKR